MVYGMCWICFWFYVIDFSGFGVCRMFLVVLVWIKLMSFLKFFFFICLLICGFSLFIVFSGYLRLCRGVGLGGLGGG